MPKYLVTLSSHVSGNSSVAQNDVSSLDVVSNGKLIIPYDRSLLEYMAPSSYHFPLDGGDAYSQIYGALAQKYPGYKFFYFDPLINSTFLDLSTTSYTINSTATVCRCAVGNVNTTLLPINGVKPGALFSQNVDLSTYGDECTNTTQILPYWEVASFSVSSDETVSSNTPAERTFTEVIPYSVPGLTAWVSVDGGISWEQVYRMRAKTLCQSTSTIKLAFVNTGTDPVYLSHFGFLFG